MADELLQWSGTFMSFIKGAMVNIRPYSVVNF